MSLRTTTVVGRTSAKRPVAGAVKGHRRCQPPAERPANRETRVHDDLIDPRDIDPAEVEEPTQDRDAGTLPDPEQLPETQGETVLDAQRQAEEASPRRLLSDEEAEGS